MSYIYDQMTKEEATRLGWYEPKEDWNPGVRTQPVFLGNMEINSQTRLFYYPGSFGSFHAGHRSVVQRIIRTNLFSQMDDNYIIVIAPANSEYAVEKYGKWSKRAQNKWRFDNIVKTLKYNFPNHLDRFVIDLNPMMAHVCDQNFTDLLKDFVDLNKIETKPTLCFGKDCEYKDLEKTGLVNVCYQEDFTKHSTRNLPKIDQEKKHLWLRCYYKEELDIFVKYFGEYYNSVNMIDINEERKFVYQMMEESNRNFFTICKDYPTSNYFKFSRVYEHPLADAVFDHHETAKIADIVRKHDGILIDSDSYSGGTRKNFVRQGIDFVVIHDFELMNKENVELLDIEDFTSKGDMRYPIRDVSSKASMPAFSVEDHKDLDSLAKELGRINFGRFRYD